MKNHLFIGIGEYAKRPSFLAKICIVFLIMSFMVYHKPLTETVIPFIKEECNLKTSASLSISNGKCSIEEAFSEDDRNKQTLLLNLYNEVLIRKKNKTEIPPFILAFFESLTANKNFELANPGELWRIGDIMDFAIRKEYNSKGKETVNIVSLEKKDLPCQQLIYFAIGKNMALLSYYTGGLRITQHIAMIQFKNNQVIDFWRGSYLDLSVNTQSEILNCIGKKKITSGNGNC